VNIKCTKCGEIAMEDVTEESVQAVLYLMRTGKAEVMCSSCSDSGETTLVMFTEEN